MNFSLGWPTRDDVDAVLKHPAIYPVISDDNSPTVDEFDPFSGDFSYLGGYINGTIFAIVSFHGDPVQVHIQVIPEFRDCALRFAKCAAHFICNHCKTNQLIAEIPDIYQNVLNFSFRVGFEIIGIKRSAYKKHGELHDVYRLRYERWVQQQY